MLPCRVEDIYLDAQVVTEEVDRIIAFRENAANFFGCKYNVTGLRSCKKVEYVIALLEIKLG
jgi:hypothetical protein